MLCIVYKFIIFFICYLRLLWLVIAFVIQPLLDSLTWIFVDHFWLNFAVEYRNLTLGVAADGMNSKNLQSSVYSYGL